MAVNSSCADDNGTSKYSKAFAGGPPGMQQYMMSSVISAVSYGEYLLMGPVFALWPQHLIRNKFILSKGAGQPPIELRSQQQ